MACGGQDEPLSFKPRVDELGPSFGKVRSVSFCKGRSLRRTNVSLYEEESQLRDCQESSKGTLKWPNV